MIEINQNVVLVLSREEGGGGGLSCPWKRRSDWQCIVAFVIHRETVALGVGF